MGYRTVPWYTFLESPCRADVKLELTCNATTHHFRDIRGQMAKVGVWLAENDPAEAFFDPGFGNP